MVVEYYKAGSDLSVPIFHRDGVGTLLSALQLQQVVKASSGHFPQPFLISKVVKNWDKDMGFYQNNKPLFSWQCPDLS